MKKYITAALMLYIVATSHAQSPRTDTAILMSVYNTGIRFKLIPADFGGSITQSLIGTMVRSYDTVMVYKQDNRADSTGRKPIRYKVERSCEKMSRDIKNKIVVMELNKDCDVTQTCLNVQRAGAKAFVIIHNSNSQGNIKLPKKGLYKDSIRIPIFTVGSNVGESITMRLPTIVGIRKPIAQTAQRAIANDSTLFNSFAEKQAFSTVEERNPDSFGKGVTTNKDQVVNDGLTNSLSKDKQSFTVSPNPATNQASVTYHFAQATDVTIRLETESGQVINSQILRGVTVGSITLSTVDYPTGTYFVTLQYRKEVQTKKLIVRH